MNPILTIHLIGAIVMTSIILILMFWSERGKRRRGKVREVFNLAGIFPDPRPFGYKTNFFPVKVIEINGTLIVYRKARPEAGDLYLIVHGQKISDPYYSTLCGEDVIKVRTIPERKQKDIIEALRPSFSGKILFWE